MISISSQYRCLAWTKFLHVLLDQNLARIKQKSSPVCHRKCSGGEGFKHLTLVLFRSMAPFPGTAAVVSVGWLPRARSLCPWGHRALVRVPREGATGTDLGVQLLLSRAAQRDLWGDVCYRPTQFNTRTERLLWARDGERLEQ